MLNNHMRVVVDILFHKYLKNGENEHAIYFTPKLFFHAQWEQELKVYDP